MATTTNFGWETPDDTDLVKDGALAMRTLGNAIDASLVDLKGGTTGQVLSKNSNTDMDFTWVTSDDANAIQNAIVDAKGDLITATAADTPARLAVGNNGETLVADSSTSTGLRYQSGVNTNAIINGGMDIWQRGTSVNGTSYNYCADRWMVFRGAFAAGATFSQQTNVPSGFRYSLRAQRDSGNTGTQSLEGRYALETNDSVRFQGQTVTLSFWARAGANWSASTAFFGLYSGTGTDQSVVNVQGLWTGGATINSAFVALTTSWVRYSITGTVSSSATQLGIAWNYTPTGTAGANDWIEFTGVQLELGSTPTAFKRAGGTLAGELAACQRYYWRHTAGTVYAGFATGQVVSTTEAKVLVPFPVPMRVNPTALEYSTVGCTNVSHGAVLTLSSMSIQHNSTLSALLAFVATTSGFTAAGNATQLVANNSTSAYIAFNAEL